jgi:hypothetical protein
MLRRLTKRRVLAGLIGLAALLLALLYPAWREAGQNGGQQPAEPFRIAGNFYHVGANDVKTFLIARPGDRVVIDGGYPGTARMILESIEKLGFDVRDVREIGWAEVLRTKTSAPACGLARERSTRGPPPHPRGQRSEERWPNGFAAGCTCAAVPAAPRSRCGRRNLACQGSARAVCLRGRSSTRGRGAPKGCTNRDDRVDIVVVSEAQRSYEPRPEIRDSTVCRTVAELSRSVEFPQQEVVVRSGS